MSDFHPRTRCRLCDAATKVVLNFGETPLANELVTREFVESGERQDVFPLSVSVCTDCGHAQLSGVVNSERIFGRDYPYRSGTSPVFRKHLEEYAAKLVERFGVPRRMLEIGSNDGTFLRMFQERGSCVMGVDPASRAAEDAPPTSFEPFTANLARKIRASLGLVDLVVANHVLAHIDNLRDVIDGVLEVLTDEGVFVFEVGYLADVVEKGLFDVVYHEHVSYHHLGPLIGFFDRLEMDLFDAQRVDTQGGALRCFVSHKRSGLAATRISDRAGRLLEHEEELQLWSPATVADTVAILKPKTDLLDLLKKLKGEGARIAGFGCPAKAVTLMHAIGFGAGMLDFIVDENPAKQGKYTPRLPTVACESPGFSVNNGHIEIVPPEALGRDPDFILILAWNFAEDIMYRYPGRRWIVPLPKVEVIDRRDP